VSIVVETRKNINIINAVSANDAEGISGVLRAIVYFQFSYSAAERTAVTANPRIAAPNNK